VPGHAVIDHVFLCVEKGAPEAAKLIEFGRREGAPNTHPGQGTANRRFFFDNAMLELIWVENAAEAQSEQTRRTMLWERWSLRAECCPFGIILAAAHSGFGRPFDAWEYRPSQMPGLVLQVASKATLAEPFWAWFEKPARRPSQPLDHTAGVHEVTRVNLYGPLLPPDSVAPAMARDDVIGWRPSGQHLLELEFDERRSGSEVDFRPELPLLFRF
jgi:hypothetical protein